MNTHCLILQEKKLNYYKNYQNNTIKNNKHEYPRLFLINNVNNRNAYRKVLSCQV